MMPKKISETREVAEYLVKRGIFDAYLKCKAYVLAGHAQKLDFKLRQPKNAGIYQFRINQKYRAFWIYRDGADWERLFVVFKISDHQDF